MKNHFRGVALALALTSLSSLPAKAENEPDRRATFESARDAMQAKHWDEAHRLFLLLWENQHTYDVALHLGQVEYHLKRFREAASHIDYGLMLLPPREKPEIAERSRTLLALCTQELGTLKLSVKNKGATLLIDGNPVAEAPLITDTYVEAGKHRFEVRLEGYQSEKWEAEFDRGDSLPRIVQLKAVPVTAQPSSPALGLAPATTARPVDSSPHQASWTPVVVGGALSLVGLGTGLAFALVRGGLTDDAKSLRGKVGPDGCQNPSGATIALCRKLEDKNSDYDTYGSLEGAGFALGTVALVATATYFFIARPDQVQEPSVKTAAPLRLDGSFGKGSARLQLSADF